MQYAVQHLSRKIDDTSVEKMLKKVTWPTLTEDFRRSRNSFKLSMFSKQNESRSHLLNVKKYKLSLEKFKTFEFSKKRFSSNWIFNPRKKIFQSWEFGKKNKLLLISTFIFDYTQFFFYKVLSIFALFFSKKDWILCAKIQRYQILNSIKWFSLCNFFLDTHWGKIQSLFPLLKKCE